MNLSPIFWRPFSRHSSNYVCVGLFLTMTFPLHLLRPFTLPCGALSCRDGPYYPLEAPPRSGGPGVVMRRLWTQLLNTRTYKNNTAVRCTAILTHTDTR